MTLADQLAQAFLAERPAEAAQELERLPGQHRADTLRSAPVAAARAVEQLTSASAAEALAHLTSEEAAPLLEQLSIHRTLALLRYLPADVATRMSDALPGAIRESLQRVLQYPDGTAGALMDPRVFAIPDDIVAGEARVRVRRQVHGLLHYLYIVDRTGALVGVLDIPELLQAGAREPIRAVMHTPVEHVPAWTPAAAVRNLPGWRNYHAMPVTDDDGRLVGAIRYQTLRQLEGAEDGTRVARNTAETVVALGELFHLGMAGIVEGVAAATAAQDRRRNQSHGAPR